MNAHQPGSEPLEIPEQIPNPAVRPLVRPEPEQRPSRKRPVKVPEKVPANLKELAGTGQDQEWRLPSHMAATQQSRARLCNSEKDR